MPDLITVYDSEGKAIAQTADIVEEVIKNETDGREIRNDAKDLDLIECQGTELDEDLASHFFKKVVILPDKERK